MRLKSKVPVCLSMSRPDTTFAVDWVLKTNYLSSLPLNAPQIHDCDFKMLIFPYKHPEMVSEKSKWSPLFMNNNVNSENGCKCMSKASQSRSSPRVFTARWQKNRKSYFCSNSKMKLSWVHLTALSVGSDFADQKMTWWRKEGKLKGQEKGMKKLAQSFSTYRRQKKKS